MAATSTTVFDCLVIGGGPAGLSAALGLGRQLRSTLVFDSQKYRNRYAERMHNILTWDHKTAPEFRAAARQNIEARYDMIRFKNATIASAVKMNDGIFELTDTQDQKYRGKKLVLATGVTDLFPDIKGFEQLWGKTIFHCLFCHGFEERGAASAGIIALGLATQPAVILHVARMTVPMAEKITIYCHGDEEICAQVTKEFEGKPLTIEVQRIIAVEEIGGRVRVHLASGETREEGFLVCAPPVQINGSFHEQLGLESEPAGFIKTNGMFYETNVPGVFAIGDCGTMMKSVPQAMTMGSFTAAGVVGQLGAEGEI